MKRQIKAFCSKRMMLLATGILFLTVIFSFTNVTIAGGKPDLIRYGCIIDITGPYAVGTGPIGAGLEDAWKYINTELNGVRGVKVEVVIRDMAGKMPLALSMYNELINMRPKPMFVSLGSSPFAAAVRERTKEDGIIAHVPTALDCLYPLSNSFGIYPLYEELTALALKYIKGNWKEKRNLKIGIITWDTTFGRAILTDDFFAYLKTIGVDIVGTELYSIKDIDVTSQLLRLRDKGPDLLVSNSAAGGIIAIKKGCKDMGWNIKLLCSVGLEWGTARIAPELFDGDMCVLNTRSFDEVDHPSIKKVMKYFNENNRTIKEATFYYLISGWVMASLSQAAMVSVVDKHGWEGFNIPNLMEATWNMRDLKPTEGLSDVTYTKQRPVPTKARIYKIEKGKLLPLTADFMEVPDLRPAKYK